MRAKTYFNHLGYWQRIKLFFRTKRRRFLYIFLFFVAFNYIGNLAGFFLARLERSGRKYKKAFVMWYNPLLMTYQTAIDTLYEPSKLSVASTERLAEAFLRIDRQLKHGVSRLLLITAMRKGGIDFTPEETAKFLADSGASTLHD